MESWIGSQEIWGSSSCNKSVQCTKVCARSCCPPSACSCCCQGVVPPAKKDDGIQWTSKYLRSNSQMRSVVNTLLELAFGAPPCCMEIGKICIDIKPCLQDHACCANPCCNTCCYTPQKQVVRVSTCGGWCNEFVVNPCVDYCSWNKYNICEFVQDNWFVISAILKDQWGLILEEDFCRRPSSLLCRKYSLAVTLTRSKF